MDFHLRVRLRAWPILPVEVNRLHYRNNSALPKSATTVTATAIPRHENKTNMQYGATSMEDGVFEGLKLWTARALSQRPRPQRRLGFRREEQSKSSPGQASPYPLSQPAEPAGIQRHFSWRLEPSQGAEPCVRSQQVATTRRGTGRNF
jgi:hypothetical protein